MNWLTHHSVRVGLAIGTVGLFSISTSIYAAPNALGNSLAKTKKSKLYRPKIFKPHEFKTLTVFTETILRDDEMPGAQQAKASEFIDFQITYDPEIQDRFRSGLRWLDEHSRRLYKRDFVSLKPEQRRDIIQCLEVKALHRPGEERGREFFELARRYTYMGFYASEEALREAIPSPVRLRPPRHPRIAGAAGDD